MRPASRTGPAKPASQHLAALTLSEAVLLVLLLAPAAMMLIGYALDVAGWPIAPRAVGTLSALAVGGTVLVLARSGVLRPLHRGVLDEGALLLTLAGFFAFAMALAAPSFLPRTHSGDTVNHLLLIDFIRLHRVLPHDPALRYYLGDMVAYPPGGHLLAALVAAWLGTTGVRVLHAVMAYSVAAKAALVYSVTVRLLPGVRTAPVFGLCASLFLLFPFEYVIGPLLRWGFYAQALAETFALATLWALVLFDQTGRKRVLTLFAVFGVGTLLTWVGWLLVPLAAFTVWLVLRRGLSPRAKLAAWVVAVPAVALLGVLDTLTRRADSSMLTAEGSVLAPSVEAFGLPLLVFGGLGALVAARQQRALPVLCFLGMLLGQATMLWALQTRLGVSTYYATFKTLYLAVYPLAILAGVALATLWTRLERTLGRLQEPRWAWLSLAVPVVLIGAVLWTKPRIDWPSAITQPLYESGVWARDHLPNGCVDVLLSKWPAHWVTVDWLQMSVFGNPALSERSRLAEQKFKRRRVSRDLWDDPDRLPYAIVGSWQELPRRVKDRYTILYTSSDGTSAVVQRKGEASQTCRDDTPTVDQLVIQPRTGTLASALAALVPAKH